MAKRKKRKAAPGDVATNRQAGFRYHLLERLEAGIVLQGSEVKSLREGAVQLKDAYAEVRHGEVWLRNMHIAPYKPAAGENHDPDRPRKLLLHRREIDKLDIKLTQRGYTLIPLSIYLKNGTIKLEVGLARGKRQYEKRESKKAAEADREIDRAIRR